VAISKVPSFRSGKGFGAYALCNDKQILSGITTLQLDLDFCLQAPDMDEARRSTLVEDITFIIGNQTVVVEGDGRFSAHTEQ